MICGMLFSIDLLIILFCFGLGIDVPILQNKTILLF